MYNSKRHNRAAWGTPVRHRLYAGVFTALLAIGVTAPVHAQRSDAPQEYSIQAGSLGEALNQLATQSNLQIVYPPELVEGKTASNLNGRHTWRGALQQLLRGTGLEWGLVNDSTVVIKKAERDVKPPRKPANTKPDAVSPAVSAAEGITELETITVTGTNIRGVNPTVPTITIPKEEIDKSGYVTLAEFFETLPQNFPGISPRGFSGESRSQLAASNREGANGIDLRGLGGDSTLVLINGQRRAGGVDGRVIDISAIPLSAIRKIEVTTGGGSSIYGSDAVAGVVNIITKRDWQGFESQASLSSSGNGSSSTQLSQLAGVGGEYGGFLISYDYLNEDEFDGVTAGLVASPSVTGLSTTKLFLRPASIRHSIMASGSLLLSNQVEAYSDIWYSRDHNRNERSIQVGAFQFDDTERSRIEQFGVSSGISWNISGTWTGEVTGLYSRNNTKHEIDRTGSSSSLNVTTGEATLWGAKFISNGELGSIFGKTILAAVGTEYRKDIYNGDSRNVSSAFGEARIRLDHEDVPGESLEIAASGRWDRYTRFGNTFNPQIGLTWNPSNAVTWKAAYSTAFRAPALSEIGEVNGVVIQNLPDPESGGISPVAIYQGNNPDLTNERASSWTTDISYRLPLAVNTVIGATYFNIEYKNRLEVPAGGGDLVNVLNLSDRFPGLIVRNPTDAQGDAIIQSSLASSGVFNFSSISFDPQTQSLVQAIPNIILFDNRVNNIARESIEGIDIYARSDIPFGENSISFDLSGSYVINHYRLVTKNSPELSLINQPGRSADIKVRGSIGLRGQWGSFSIFTNYVSGYPESLEEEGRRVSSSTTSDISFILNSYGMVREKLGALSASLSVQNIFDETPPVFMRSSNGLLFDPANANPFGRTVTLRIRKEF